MQSLAGEIQTVKTMFKQLTGNDAPPMDDQALAIPPEVEPERFVRENLEKLYALFGTVMGNQPSMASIPALNVFENDTEWLCSVDLPGVSKERCNVHLEGNSLHIRAERAFDLADMRPQHVEAGPMRFERIITLPHSLKQDSISTRLEGGVLTVRMSKEHSGSRRDVPVQSA